LKSFLWWVSAFFRGIPGVLQKSLDFLQVNCAEIRGCGNFSLLPGIADSVGKPVFPVILFSRRGRAVFRVVLAMWMVLLLGGGEVYGLLSPSDLLLVVNESSPTSQYVADLYRQYYPEINDNQVIRLSGLNDCSGLSSTAADEIISRGDFNSLIADPIRQHLVSNNMVNSTRAIVTTAGLPYRIEDTVYSNVITPGGSVPYSSAQITAVNAASVESELSVLFQIDPAGAKPLSTGNRVVNPYQGYRSGIDEFSRDIMSSRDQMNWMTPYTLPSTPAPIMEGVASGRGVTGRAFSAGDIYLTCRLDGPKNQGESAVFAVHDMLERSRRASSGEYGINPLQAVAVLDDSGDLTNLNYNRVFNLDRSQDFVTSDGYPMPPSIYSPATRDDYDNAYYQMTGGGIPVNGQANSGSMLSGYDMEVLLDKRVGYRTSQADLRVGQGVVALGSFGRNGDEGSGADYLTNGGAGGEHLYDATYGAVFTSIESFNGVTMFSDVATSVAAQGKIVDFLELGGSGAIGHSFEPYSDAIIDNEFFLYNLLADGDGDGYADMSFLEAAFSGLPYLSWSEVVLGDPLMQIAYGVGGLAGERLEGDINLDGIVDYNDITLGSLALGGELGDEGLYNDLIDINHDGRITYYDLWLASNNLGNVDFHGQGYYGETMPIPEPGSIVLLGGLGMLNLCRRRSNRRKG